MLQEYNVKPNLSYEDTVATLEHKLADIRFGVLFKIDLAEKIKSKGLELTILEICNPSEVRCA